MTQAAGSSIRRPFAIRSAESDSLVDQTHPPPRPVKAGSGGAAQITIGKNRSEASARWRCRKPGSGRLARSCHARVPPDARSRHHAIRPSQLMDRRWGLCRTHDRGIVCVRLSGSRSLFCNAISATSRSPQPSSRERMALPMHDPTTRPARIRRVFHPAPTPRPCLHWTTPDARALPYRSITPLHRGRRSRCSCASFPRQKARGASSG